MPANLYRRGDAWYARLSVAGRVQRVSLRTTDVREAKARLKALRLKAERQVFGLQDAPSWSDAVSAYITGVLDAETVKAGTAKRYQSSLRQLSEHFLRHRLPEITATEIAAYISSRQVAGATNATIRRDLTAMSRVLAYASSLGMCSGNAVDAFDRKLVRERRSAIDAPSDQAVEAAIAAVRADLGALMRFLRATGMRTGEALRARWSDIRGDELTILETKNGRARTIRLAGLPQPGGASARGRLFPAMPEDVGVLASLWQRERARLPADQRFRLHDLRHAYAIAEIRAGRDIYDLSHHLGHSSVKVTEVYLGYAAGRRTVARAPLAQSRAQGGAAGKEDDGEAGT